MADDSFPICVGAIGLTRRATTCTRAVDAVIEPTDADAAHDCPPSWTIDDVLDHFTRLAGVCRGVLRLPSDGATATMTTTTTTLRDLEEQTGNFGGDDNYAVRLVVVFTDLALTTAVPPMATRSLWVGLVPHHAPAPQRVSYSCNAGDAVWGCRSPGCTATGVAATSIILDCGHIFCDTCAPARSPAHMAAAPGPEPAGHAFWHRATVECTFCYLHCPPLLRVQTPTAQQQPVTTAHALTHDVHTPERSEGIELSAASRCICTACEHCMPSAPNAALDPQLLWLCETAASEVLARGARSGAVATASAAPCSDWEEHLRSVQRAMFRYTRRFHLDVDAATTATAGQLASSAGSSCSAAQALECTAARLRIARMAVALLLALARAEPPGHAVPPSWYQERFGTRCCVLQCAQLPPAAR